MSWRRPRHPGVCVGCCGCECIWPHMCGAARMSSGAPGVSVISQEGLGGGHPPCPLSRVPWLPVPGLLTVATQGPTCGHRHASCSGLSFPLQGGPGSLDCLLSLSVLHAQTLRLVPRGALVQVKPGRQGVGAGETEWPLEGGNTEAPARPRRGQQGQGPCGTKEALAPLAGGRAGCSLGCCLVDGGEWGQCGPPRRLLGQMPA